METLNIDNFLIPFLLTLFAGLSTGIGAAIAFFSNRENKKLLSLGLGFSAGVMIYVSFVEILVKAKESFIPIYGDALGESLAILFFFSGFAVAAIIDRLIPQDVNPHELKKSSELEVLKGDEGIKNGLNLHRTGIFMALAIAIHNFPEGFATFVSSMNSITIGISIAFAVAIHNIPEGMAVSLPIYHATGNKKQAFKLAFLSGLAEPIGAVVGYFLLLPIMGELTLGIVFGFVAGLMIYISFDELLPSSRVYGNAHTALLGLALGFAVMAISLVAFKF